MQRFAGYSRRGFTLIELAVVIVIIGLLLASVTFFAKLRREAQLQSVIADLARYQRAVQLFQEKYNQLPGDMYNATALWGADSSCPTTTWNTTTKRETCNGDGNGRISPRDYDAGSYSDFRETFRAWQQLSNAGFISAALTGAAGNSGTGLDTRVGLNVPSAQVKGVGYMLYYLRCDTCAAVPGAYFPAKYGHIIQAGKVGTNPSDYAYLPFLSPAAAFVIDGKIDDGNPAYGKVLAPPTETNCMTTAVATTAQYVSSASSIEQCSLLYITGF